MGNPVIPPPEKLLGKGNSIPPPSVLLGTPVDTQNTDKAYQEALQPRTKEDKRIAQVWSDKSDEGDFMNSLARGSDRLGSRLAKTPAMVYDLAAQATDASVNYGSAGINAIAGTDLKTDYQTTSEGFAKTFNLPENKIAKYYDERVKKSQEISAQKYDQGISEYFSNGEYKKGFNLLANSVAESAPVTISLLMGNAAGVSTAASIVGGGVAFAADKKAELDREAPDMPHDTKMNIAMANGLFEGLFEQFGITKLGGVTKEILLRDGKEAAKKIAKEGFKDVYKPVAKKYLGTSAEESISEAATQFAQNAVDKFSGYKPDMDLMEGVVDAGIVGLGAGTTASAIPALIETKQAKKANKEGEAIKAEQVKKDAQRNAHAYQVIQKGEQAVRSFKESVDSQVKEGTLTPEQGAAAITRVNAYKEYNDIVGSLELNDKQKLEIFDKTFQKQNLETEISQMGDPKKLHPLKQAEYTIKEKFASDLQKDINEILLNAQVKRETTIGTKTVDDIAKKEQQAQKAKETKPGEKKVKPTELQKLYKEKYQGKMKPEDTRSLDEISTYEYNEKLAPRLKHKKTAQWLSGLPGQKAYGILISREFNWDGKGNSVLGIDIGGRKLRFASSMKRLYPEEGKGGAFRGHFMEERFNNDFPEGTPIGTKVYDIEDEEGDVTKHIKAFRRDNGKFIGWMKMTGTGSFSPDPMQKEQLDHLETITEKDDGPELPFPEPKPNPRPTQLKVYQQTPVKKEAVKKEAIQEKTPILAENGASQENTINTEESAVRSRDNQEIGEPVLSSSPKKTVTLRTGTKKELQKLKDPVMIMALRHEVFSPYDVALQSFISGKKLTPESIRKLYRNSLKELQKRLSYVNKNGSSIPELAHNLWESHPDLNYDTSDYENAIEDVVNSFNHPKQMAIDLNHRYEQLEQQDFSPGDLEMGEVLDPIYNPRLKADVESMFDKAEELSNDEIISLANSLKADVEKWEEDNDIIKDDGEGPVFQRIKKSDEEIYAEKKFDEAEKELKAAKNAFDSKRKELDKGLIEDQEDLFGERKSTSEENLFDERATVDARNDAVTPFKARYEKAVEEYTKTLDKLKEIQGKADSQTSLFDQKETSEKADPDRIEKVVEHIRKVLPKVKVVYDENLNAAGQLKGNTITINPYYAGADTPIHEAAHILLDAMGENKVVKAAVEQLKGTKLWTDTKARYPELNEKGLANEVLAEAIGREGKGIFDKVTDQNRFIQLLNYIFEWFKQKLGLDKNIAKSLARQIISGIGTENLTGKGIKEQKFNKKDFNYYREKFLQRDTEEESEILQAIDDTLDEELSEEQRTEVLADKKAIKDQIREDLTGYNEYKKELKKIERIEMAEDLKGFTLDELIEAYNFIDVHRDEHTKDELNQAKLRIAYFLEQKRVDQLEKANVGFVKENINKKDLSFKDLWVKALGNIQERFPAIQELSKAFDDKWMQMQQERYEVKSKAEKLAKAVINEKNKSLGIRDKAKGVVMSNNSKYFEYLDNSQGEYLTDAEAKEKNLSKAQMDFLKFMRELNEQRNALDEDGNFLENQVLKLDKNFSEKWGENPLEALSYAMGGGDNLDVIVRYKDSDGKEVENTYHNAQQEILEQAKTKGKATTLGRLLKIAYQAKKGSTANYNSINRRGQLSNRFDRPRPKDRGYSKDFYKAAMHFIDDYTHVKYMGQMVPIFDSVQYLYERGIDAKLPNIKKFIEGELQSKIYQNETKTDPVLDMTLMVLRHLSSKATMAFNIKANAVNVFIGEYNNWRQEGLPFIIKGNARMFGKDKINVYAIDLLKKYDVIHPDFDSNPKIGAGKLFDKLAYFFNRIGEYQIQGSMFLGYLTKEEFDSFEYKDGEFVLKEGVDEAEMRLKMNEYKDLVSGIQGKYNEKDRRRFMRGELGKNLSQYKTWQADWFQSRFGKEFINKYDKVERGSWNLFTKAAIEELKSDFSAENNYGIIVKNGIPQIKNKQIARNLRGVLAVAALMIATGDDDENKKNAKYDQLSLESQLGNILFIFDPSQLIYILEHPVASVGLIVKLIKTIDAIWRGDAKTAKKNAKKILPYNKILDVPETVKEVTK